jgi:hypothetical protein
MSLQITNRRFKFDALQHQEQKVYSLQGCLQMNLNIANILRGAPTLAVLLLVACGAQVAVAPQLMGGAVQGKPLNLTPAVTTFASAAPGADGTGAAARFNIPTNITTDGTNLYVADASNNKIRQIVIATGVVTTLAGSPTNVAGAADGTGAAARFNIPTNITTDGTNLYVADASNNKIRQIVIATGVVTTLAGSPTNVAGAADGAGSAATFSSPYGITTDGTNLYVTDSNNNKIRKIVIATGVVSSVTGTANTASAAGAADGAGSAATFNNPYGITTDGTSLYVADANNNTIRKIQ